ncbi:MAG: 16S rRNA (guanine(527)-N(7))-methyltransferase RsmG [Haliscomenobacteraceae bacterium CHB4]|nr:Ribosomal RNA small subunit methyltransferase G [Saprospiraceae bacterium]MCE7924347.1 16S rRNA (guanine(527)-N(7))-methyltransferase RsmG [Haliscomenobacteraceae bacterium CHB4]
MQLLDKYFPALTDVQRALFRQLVPLYTEWNAKINVVSRQDIENLEERHILHSLAIAKVIGFKPDASILDLGTGGGFPGIPLAILFPDTRFTLVDGTGKKIRVVQEVAGALGLTNVTAIHARVEELKMNGQFDFVLSRGVTTLDKLLQWSQRLLKKKHMHAYPNGIIALKGGDLRAEIKSLPGKGETYSEIFPIREFFNEPFFDEKFVVYMQG